MKTFLPFLGVTAFAGLMTVPVSLGAGLMLVLTAGVGAIILQDYACRPVLALRAGRVVAQPARVVENYRLAA